MDMENKKLNHVVLNDNLVTGELVEKEDLINKPNHYHGKYEAIRIINYVIRFNNNWIMYANYLHNIFKYLWRAGMKEGSSFEQDLDKAAWYINDLIEVRKEDIANGIVHKNKGEE